MSSDPQTTLPSASRRPEISLVAPCYNEAGSIRKTATRLVESFRARAVILELILVDNGSADETGAIIDDLIAEGMPIVKARVEVNQGYGNGVLAGLRHCRAPLVGFMCADGQVDAQDVVKLYEAAASALTPRLFKIRRRFRMDGWSRLVISTIYNIAATALFGNLHTSDINANPKILTREHMEQMSLRSKDWFLDAEVMIKARRLGLAVFELNVLAQSRLEGASHVRPATVWEFILNLLRHRYGDKRWVLEIAPPPHRVVEQVGP